MVATIIALVVFFVLIDSEDDHLHNMAISVASLTELSLYSLTTIAVLIGIFQVKSSLTFIFHYIKANSGHYVGSTMFDIITITFLFI